MVVKHLVQGYDKFCDYMKQFDGKKQEIYVYFSGSKTVSGLSWCSDCVEANPIVERALEKASSDAHFIYVEVGDVTTWRNPNCPFRKDKRTNLLVIPTLLKWENPQRLEGDVLKKPEIVEMIFENDD